MTAAYFEDHPTDPNKVILRKRPCPYCNDTPRTWVGLTSADWNDFNAVKSNDPQYVAAWAEAKLKKKNT